MKKWMMAGVAVATLSGCAQLTDFNSAVQTPPPAALVGNWQTFGPQQGLVSPDAQASLIVTASGETLDCRQWQRVIAKPGKVTLLDGDWVNVNNQSRVMPLVLEGSTLRYDKLRLQKVALPTVECREALGKQTTPAQQVGKPTGVSSDQPVKKKHSSMIYTQKKTLPGDE